MDMPLRDIILAAAQEIGAAPAAASLHAHAHANSTDAPTAHDD
jgi:hypothetical protein